MITNKQAWRSTHDCTRCMLTIKLMVLLLGLWHTEEYEYLMIEDSAMLIVAPVMP